MPVFTKDDTSILFVHIPKAGGTSIESWFMRAGWERTYYDGKTARHSPNWHRHNSPQHMHASQLKALFRLERFDVIFTVVREPLARFRSEYLMRTAKDPHTDSVSVDAWAETAFRRFATDGSAFDNHLRPQTEFLLPGSKVYRLEDGLDALATDLIDGTGLDLPRTVPRARESTKVSGISSKEVRLSPSLTTRLRAIYAQDRITFGYGDTD